MSPDTCPPAPALESLGLMEPGPGHAAFSSADWAFALPMPGYHVLAAFGAGGAPDAGCGARPGCRLRTARGVEAARWFPEVARALAALRQPASAVLDGELCVPDAAGRSNLRLLHERALNPGTRRPRAGGAPVERVVLVLRDVLVWGSRDVRALPWSERRRLLARLPLQGMPALRLQRCMPGEGLWLARQAQALGHAAIDAFRCDAPYVAGPSIGWLQLPLASDQGLAA